MSGSTLRPGDGVDLHVHTTVYDGRWTPAGIVQHAAGHGIRFLAICDHDLTSGIRPAQTEGEAAGVTVIPAVEVTTRWRENEYHVLLYGAGIDPAGREVEDLLTRIQRRQRARAHRWVEALAERGLLLPSLDAVRRGRELLPRYVAIALIRDHHVPHYAACVPLLKSLPATPDPAAPLAEVVAAAHATGAVAIIAHPGRNEYGFAALDERALDAMVAESGLDGIEVYHPHHSPTLRAQYLEYARSRRLLVSAGSDSHGPAHSRVPVAHPAEQCWALLERILPAAPALPSRTTAPTVAGVRANAGTLQAMRDGADAWSTDDA